MDEILAVDIHHCLVAAFPGGPACPQRLLGLTIDYTYDPLQRLTAADYSTGDYYHYSYDPVGNRLSQQSSVDGLPPALELLGSTVDYVYDDANRIDTVDEVAYTFDANPLARCGDHAAIYWMTASTCIRMTSPTGWTRVGLMSRCSVLRQSMYNLVA